MISEVVAWILVILFAIISFLLGKKLSIAVKIVHKMRELLEEIDRAIEDGKLEYEEAKRILEKVNELKELIEELIGGGHGEEA